MKKIGFLFIFLLFPFALFAQKIINVYAWGGEIPRQVIQLFEKETGIKVNFSTYDNNETMYAKLKVSSKPIYDVILPSSYFVERMKKQHLLTKLDHNLLPNLNNLDPLFMQGSYDPKNQYSAPLIWGLTGIFYDKKYLKSPPQSWKDCWSKRFNNQLLLLDDSREIFAIALLALGYDPNDTNPHHIKKAFQYLKQLIPNIKLFASESIQAIMIDEDASIGSAWNGDAYKAQQENPDINFIFPADGFVIWVDCLAIPKNPPHPHEAYQFINFMFRPEVGKIIARAEGHAITNQQARSLLPQKIAENKMIYPGVNILKRGVFQRDVGEETLELYNKYWEELKLAF